MANLSVALTTARSYLNDVGGNVWAISPNDLLIPFAQEAHRELQARLWNVGSPVVRAKSLEITVASGTTDMAALSNYPTDILTPFRLVEYATNQTIASGVDITEVVFIPQEAQLSTLQYYCWIDEDIQLLGATTNRKVVIYYRKQIPIPVLGSDPIGVLFGELYLGAAIAAKGHGSLGNIKAFNILSQMAESNFQTVVQSQRGQQSPSSRP